MPRKPRFFLADIPIHAIVRGNDKKAIFAEEADKTTYLEIAKEVAISLQVTIHAYVLMDNHVHWLISSAIPAVKGVSTLYLSFSAKPFIL